MGVSSGHPQPSLLSMRWLPKFRENFKWIQKGNIVRSEFHTTQLSEDDLDCFTYFFCSKQPSNIWAYILKAPAELHSYQLSKGADHPTLLYHNATRPTRGWLTHKGAFFYCWSKTVPNKRSDLPVLNLPTISQITGMIRITSIEKIYIMN